MQRPVAKAYFYILLLAAAGSALSVSITTLCLGLVASGRDIILLATPLVCVACAGLSLFLSPRPRFRVLAGLLILPGLLLFFLGFRDMMYASKMGAQRHRPGTEKQTSREIFEKARVMLKAKQSQVLVKGRYQAIEGSIVDVIVIGVPAQVTTGDISVSSGKISRFTWHVSGAGHRRFHQIRRFLFLLEDAGKKVRLNTPYGDVPLPEPGPMPASVAVMPPFADQSWLRFE